MTTLADRDVERSAHRALLCKELAESRPALIAGAVIFLGLPLFWMGLYAAIDRHHEVFPGVASTLLALVGWLFSAVVAAQSIGRDFGRRQGDFLLARPVTVAQVLQAKIVVGFGLVLGVLAAVGVLELVLAAGVRDARIRNADDWHVWPYAAAACIVAYWVALAGAAITRQMLSGVMLAGLALALLLTTAFTSSVPARAAEWLWKQTRPDRPLFVLTDVVPLGCGLLFLMCVLYPILSRILAPRGRQPSLWSATLVAGLALAGLLAVRVGGARWAILVGGLALAAVVSHCLTIVACRAERAWRLGTKAIAWTVGLTTTLVCTLAMSEVGSNANISDAHWVPAPLPAAYSQWAIGQARIAEGVWGHFVNLYDIGACGEIQCRGRCVDTYNWWAPGSPVPRVALPLFDANDELYVVVSAVPRLRSADDGRAAREWPLPFVISVDWNTGTPDPPRELERPALIPPQAWGIEVYDAAIQPPYLFVLYYCAVPRTEVQPGTPTSDDLIAVACYGWSDGPTGLIDARRLGCGSRGIRERRSDWWWPEYQLRRGVDGRLQTLWAPFPVPHDLEPWRSSGLGRVYDYDVESEVSKGLSLRTMLRIDDNTLAASDRTQFAVAQVYDTLRARNGLPIYLTKLVGRVRASPWALLFRSDYPIMVPGRLGQVWEVHDAGAICYDVSDPQRPHKLAHVSSHPIVDALAGPEYLLLVHEVGISIVQHPPASRK